MKQKQLRSAVFVLVLVASLAGSFLAGRIFADRRVVRAQSPGAPAAPADPNMSSFYCGDVNNVASFDNRIHLRCSTTNYVGSDPVQYYAYPVSGSSGYTANRMLAVGQIAYALNRGVWIFYEASSSYNPPGCSSSNCRLLVGVSVIE